jgi:quinol monooxygenase YgiN
MIGIVATMRVVEGKGAEFEAVFTKLAAQVRANEPGCLFYQLTKSRKDPNVYKVLEGYKDQAAVDAHGSSEYFKSGFGEMRGLLDGRADIELLDGV